MTKKNYNQKNTVLCFFLIILSSACATNNIHPIIETDDNVTLAPASAAPTPEITYVQQRPTAFLKAVDSDEMKFWINYFTKRDKDRFERYLQNGEKYRPMIEKTFADHGLPPELYFVGLIESGYYLQARSHASAVGPWQFIKDTGKRYGLTINSSIDERKNIIKSTLASAKFFQDLYNIFGTWELALSAYNAGEYGIIRRIRKANTRNFYELIKKNALPKETVHYVPKVLAAIEIFTNHKKYGINLPKITKAEQDFYLDTDEVVIKQKSSLRTISSLSGIPLSEMKKLNFCLNTNSIPYLKSGISIIVPKNKKHLVQSLELPKLQTRRISSTTRSKRSREKQEYRKYKIKKGDNLYTIAARNKISVQEILDLNDMKRKTIYVGQVLHLPFVEKKYHIVRKGDHLNKISKMYSTSIQDLKKYNSLADSTIFPGQKLVVNVQ